MQEAAKRLNSSLGVETVYCDAPDFDAFWLGRLFEAAALEMNFTLADLFEIYDDLTNAQVLAMLERLNDTPVLHRALPDAERYATAYQLAICPDCEPDT